MFCNQKKETFVGVSLLQTEPFAIYINRKESFMYGLPDFPRKDNTLLGSKLTSYFKQIQ